MPASHSKKIWHLVSNRWNSAITEYALSCSLALNKTGAVNYLSPLKNSLAESRARSLNLQVFPMADFHLNHYFQFLAQYNRLLPDVLITYGGPETTLANLLMYKPNSLKIFRVRGQTVANGGFLQHLQHRLAHRLTDAVIAPSQSLASHLKATINIDAKVVTLGCDVNRFKPAPTLDRSETEFVVLGRFDLVKGHDHCLAIFKLLLNIWPTSDPRPVLHFIGEEANLKVSDLASGIHRHGLLLDKEVKITARRVGNIGDYLSRATLGIIPSIDSEIICRVGEEFLLCGTPIVVSGVGSLEDILFSGAGASYRGKSDKESAKLILDQALLSRKEGVEAKFRRSEKARELFSLEAMARILEGIIFADQATS